MKRRPIRPLVLACAALAVSALGTGAADYTNLLARTDSFLSAFGLDPAAPVTRRAYADPFPVSPVEATNGDAVVYFHYRPGATPQTASDSWPMRIQLFLERQNGAPAKLGYAYLPRQMTNSVDVLVSPILNSSLSVESTTGIWRLDDVTNGIRFISFPGFGQTNGIPNMVFLARNGVSCFLRTNGTTNLCELADFVCDALSERFFAEE